MPRKVHQLSPCLSTADWSPQASCFWRPSAWADLLYAYSPWDRMLLGPFHWNFIPTHIFSDLVGIFLGAGILAAACSLTLYQIHGFGLWVRTAGLVVAAWLLQGGFIRSVAEAMGDNLTLGKPQVSQNMPMLSAHLRQLEAAGCVVRHQVAEGHAATCIDLSHLYPAHMGPAPPAAASLFTSLALMHALKNHAWAKFLLLTRLHIACAACIYHTGKMPRHTVSQMTQADGLE